MHLNSNRLCLDGACERQTERGRKEEREKRGGREGEEMRE